MRILESKIEREVVKWWESGHRVQIKLNILGRRGWPDRLFLKPSGKAVFIEFKQVNEVARPLQVYWHEKLRSLGYAVYVCDNADYAKRILARS